MTEKVEKSGNSKIFNKSVLLRSLLIILIDGMEKCPRLAESRMRLVFFFIRPMAPLLVSIKVQDSAPLLNASTPKAPVPAKRSRTWAPGICSERILKSASLARSEVGRIALLLLGPNNFRPLAWPLIIRKTS